MYDNVLQIAIYYMHSDLVGRCFKRVLKEMDSLSDMSNTKASYHTKTY